MSVPSGRMVRNLVTTTTERPAPKRGWRKKTGPGESSRTRNAINAISGAMATSRASAPSRSIAAFSFQDSLRVAGVPAVCAAAFPWPATPV